MKRFILAITGASGAIIGIRLLEELLKTSEVHLIISDTASKITLSETGIDLSTIAEETLRKKFNTDSLFHYDNDQLWAPIASGSFKIDGMFIVPCSMKTLSAISNGYAVSLVERAADVTIKEKRPLVISPREMPLSSIHLENMLKLARLGVCIAPPIPAFYPKPATVQEVIDFLVGKILDCMKIENDLFKRWGGKT
ncbi:MAG: UbiX family flavin prenyltransferase [Thermodesulfovibrionales bacterium]|nr:UbiX family flavin prenyltransferase [Thermodesulfovibrionales bacterium]